MALLLSAPARMGIAVAQSDTPPRHAATDKNGADASTHGAAGGDAGGGGDDGGDGGRKGDGGDAGGGGDGKAAQPATATPAWLQVARHSSLIAVSAEAPAGVSEVGQPPATSPLDH